MTIVSTVAFAVLSWAAPQEVEVPSAAPLVREVLAEKEMLDAAQESARGLVSPAAVRGELRGLETPWLAMELRSAGLDAADLARERVSLNAELDPIDAALRLAMLCGAKKVRDPKRKRVDLKKFETACERVFRDVMGAIGTGREIESEAAKLHAALEHLQFVGPIDREAVWEDPIRDLLEERMRRIGRVDTEQLASLARTLAVAALELGDPRVAKKMRKAEPGVALIGARGVVFEDRESSFGRFVIGGFGDNEYDCSQIDVIVDLGGNDTYRGQAGGTGEQSRFAVVVDLSGDDRYEALGSGLGSGTFGLGLLVDHQGNDVYRGGERCLGFGAAGVGVFIDVAGDDDYEVGSMGGGVGVARGVGVCIDRAGLDRYTAGPLSMGCGMPGGIGLHVDLEGDDTRVLKEKMVKLVGGGALTPCSLGLGVGIGLAPELPGGLGVCLDTAGTDTYTAEGLALGVGVGGGTGVFRDLGQAGDTVRAGTGSLGCGILGGLGIALDDGGDDVRSVSGSFGFGCSIGRAGDKRRVLTSAGWFVDVAGDDRYQSASVSAFGVAQRGAFAACVDFAGNDSYERPEDGLVVWPAAQAAAADSVGILLDVGGEAELDKLLGLLKPGNPTQATYVTAEDGTSHWILRVR